MQLYAVQRTVRESVLKVEILLLSQHWHLKLQHTGASFENRLAKERPAKYCGPHVKGAGRRWNKPQTSETRSCFIRSLSYLNCEFVISLPSSVAHGLQMDFVGSVVLHCPPILAKSAPETAVCSSDAGSWLCSTRNELLYLFYLYREHIVPELLVITYNFHSTNLDFRSVYSCLQKRSKWVTVLHFHFRVSISHRFLS